MEAGWPILPDMNMKRRLYALLVLVSLSVEATVTLVTVTHLKHGIPYTLETVRFYIEAACYDENHGLPTPTIQFDNGQPFAFGCAPLDA
jgi:hypothetical protein